MRKVEWPLALLSATLAAVFLFRANLHTDDTGIIVGLILLFAGILAFLDDYLLDATNVDCYYLIAMNARLISSWVYVVLPPLQQGLLSQVCLQYRLLRSLLVSAETHPPAVGLFSFCEV